MRDQGDFAKGVAALLSSKPLLKTSLATPAKVELCSENTLLDHQPEVSVVDLRRPSSGTTLPNHHTSRVNVAADWNWIFKE
jgi:hypothetical protein